MTTIVDRLAGIGIDRAGLDGPLLASVPGWLSWLRIKVFALTVATAIVGVLTFLDFQQVVQTVGRDTVPSIVASERIRARLADAHTDLFNIYLTHEAPGGPSARAFEQAIADVQGDLVTAAQNITYGDEEKRPLTAAMAALAEYEKAVGGALANGTYSTDLIDADRIMNQRILPAITDLNHANASHLVTAYADGRASAELWLGIFALLTAVLTFTLWQVLHFHRGAFRRLINLGTAVGAGVMLVSALLFALAGWGVLGDVRVAKLDAFDSLDALSQAKSLAYQANASESLYLLATGVAADQARQDATFHAIAARLLDADAMADIHNPQPATLKGHGLLADELANITFAGEAEQAQAAAENWKAYVDIDSQIRALEASGQHAQAVALCLGTAPHQSDWAFEKYIAALGATAGINQDQFDSHVAAAFSKLFWMKLLILPILLAPLLGVYFGLRPRFAEFEG